jgi:hypothetical protein
MIQLTYIPDVMKQNEAKHMDEISNQFSRLKAMMDIQAKKNSTIPISNIITMGNKQLPYLVTIPSRGTISIIDNDTTTNGIKINDDINKFYKLTSIKYESNNIYFVPQTYILEGGGVIIKQPEGNPVMWEDPTLNATLVRDGSVTKVKIYLTIPLIICEDKNYHISGLDFCYVRTNYSYDLSEEKIFYDVDNITIFSEYSCAWFNFTDNSFEKNVKENINCIPPSPGSNYFRIKKVNTTIDLKLRINYIYVKLN